MASSGTHSTPLRVAFIGAGGVNFGGHGNAWDHASRLESFVDSIIFVGIADVFTQQAEKVLNIRRAGKHASLWKDTKTFADYREMLKEVKPDCAFIGLPPNCHGSDVKCVELDCIAAKCHAFIEKPISCTPPEVLSKFASTITAAEKSEVIVSVAYMFRYSAMMRKVKELIQSFGEVKLFQAKYYCAYSNINKLAWWDADQSGGPVVEQGTHFVDLARYFCGDADLSTLQALSLKATEPIAALSKIPVDESSIPVERRIPRVTTATWRFNNGAIGTLTHTALLHGWNYETQIEILGDGYYISVRDPYEKCLITYRAPGTEEEQTLQLRDDPYKTEIEAFINAIKTGDRTLIQSNFEDAFKTYQLTWAIRRKAEESASFTSPKDHRKTTKELQE